MLNVESSARPLYKLTLDLTVPIPSYRAAYLTKIRR